MSTSSNNHYWSQNNIAPGDGGTVGGVFGRAGNNITIRGNEMPERLASTPVSRNLSESTIKLFRFYRKVCRLMPFILRIHNMQSKTTSIGAVRNVADLIREKYHMRDPQAIDQQIEYGYEFLMQAEQHFTQHTLLYQFLCPPWKAMGDRGYSYLEKVKYGKKSKFLTDFYVGSKPTDF